MRRENDEGRNGMTECPGVIGKLSKGVRVECGVWSGQNLKDVHQGVCASTVDELTRNVLRRSSCGQFVVKYRGGGRIGGLGKVGMEWTERLNRQVCCRRGSPDGRPLQAEWADLLMRVSVAFAKACKPKSDVLCPRG